MAYDQDLADRVEACLQKANTPFESKRMMGGLCLMVEEKMCVGVEGTRLMARVGPDAYEEALTKPGATEMNFTGRPMKGWVFVDQDELYDDKVLAGWVQMALDFNPLAQRSKKKRKQS